MKSRLPYQIVAPSLAVSLLLLVLGGSSAWYVHNQQQTASIVLYDGLQRIRAAEDIVSACREVRFHLNQFAITGDRSYLEMIQPISAELQDSLGRAEIQPPSEDQADLIAKIRSGHMGLNQELDSVLDPSQSNPRGKAHELAQNVVTSLMLAPAELFLEANEAAIDHSTQRSRAIAGRVALSFLLLGLCGSVAGLTTGYAIARSLRHTLVQLHVPIRLATGRLEEAIGPIDLVEPADLDDLDSGLERLAERIGVVVDRLRESQMELLRAEQLAALGQLAAGLAHELRNPLTAIKILVQTAAEGGESASLEGRDLVVLEEELTRLERSIQRFLDFAKPPELEKRLFDIRHVIQSIVDLLAARAARQQVLIRTELPDIAVEILADYEQVRQLLLNTVLNSLDAVGRGGNIDIELAIAAESLQARDGNAPTDSRTWAVVRVRDNGPGIPRELGDRIFEPFVSTKDTGIGLGLAICRRIVDAHGGRMAAANVDHGGAELLIRLPMSPSSMGPVHGGSTAESVP